MFPNNLPWNFYELGAPNSHRNCRSIGFSQSGAVNSLRTGKRRYETLWQSTSSLTYAPSNWKNRNFSNIKNFSEQFQGVTLNTKLYMYLEAWTEGYGPHFLRPSMVITFERCGGDAHHNLWPSKCCVEFFRSTHRSELSTTNLRA